MALDNDIQRIASDLNLSDVGNNRFIGHVDRVPFRMEVVLSQQTLGLLFHTRFSKALKPLPEYPSPPIGGVLEGLVAQKKAELSADINQIWFNLFATHELIERNSLLQALREFTDTLKPYVDFGDQACFACKNEAPTLPIYHSEKLHLVCDSCHALVNQKAIEATKIDPANVIFSLLWGSIVSIVGGVIWCLGWSLYAHFLGGRQLPIIVFGLCDLAVAMAVALPIAFVFKRIPRRGNALAKITCIVTSILTAAWGELFYCGKIFFTATGSWPNFSQALAVFKILASEQGAFTWFSKIIAAVILCIATIELGSPKTSLESLNKT